MHSKPHQVAMRCHSDLWLTRALCDSSQARLHASREARCGEGLEIMARAAAKRAEAENSGRGLRAPRSSLRGCASALLLLTGEEILGWRDFLERALEQRA